MFYNRRSLSTRSPSRFLIVVVCFHCFCFFCTCFYHVEAADLSHSVHTLLHFYSHIDRWSSGDRMLNSNEESTVQQHNIIIKPFFVVDVEVIIVFFFSYGFLSVFFSFHYLSTWIEHLEMRQKITEEKTWISTYFKSHHLAHVLASRLFIWGLLLNSMT